MLPLVRLCRRRCRLIGCCLILAAVAASWARPIAVFAQAAHDLELPPFAEPGLNDPAGIRPVAFASAFGTRPLATRQPGPVRWARFAGPARPAAESPPSEPLPAPSSTASPAEPLPLPARVKNYLLSEPAPCDSCAPSVLPGMFGQAFGYPPGVYGAGPGYPAIPGLGKTVLLPSPGPRSALGPHRPDVLLVNGVVRTYYLNDQRIEWSGAEETFGAQAALRPQYLYQGDEWTAQVNSEFFLNQPSDRNLRRDQAPQMASYLADFQTPIFQIFELNARFTWRKLAITLGKAPTPFGRYYFPILSNARFDAPFIRTEAIGFQETGLFLHYQPGLLVLDAALTNGGQDRDTNSSKALVARAGLQGENWAIGTSIKWQDGVGSETIKEYDNHAGVDAMLRFGNFILSSEAIYDQYGFRHAYDPNNIYWGRSLYYRDTYNANLNAYALPPITGVGYYVDLGWRRGRWTADFNYGDFFPQQIGNPYHDAPNRRGIFKLIATLTPRIQAFGMVLLENQRPVEAWRQNQKPELLYFGFQLFL